MRTPPEAAFVYTDLQGLAGLRYQVRQNHPQALRQAAQQFEAVFIQMLLKTMRAASPTEGDLLDSEQGRLYRDLFDQQIALTLAQRGQLGLGEAIARRLGNDQRPAPPVSPNLVGDPLAQWRHSARLRAHIGTAASSAASPSATAAAATDPQPVEATAYSPSSPVAFVRRMWPHAQAAAQQLGVAAEVLIAQAAHETAWGRAVPRFADGRTSYNLFGIKAHGHWQGERVVNTTLEFVNGVPVRQQDGFRAYGCYSESFSDYVRFIQSNPRYQPALAQVKDSAAYLRALQQAGYATDPHYASKIQRLMNGPSFSNALKALKSASTAPITDANG